MDHTADDIIHNFLMVKSQSIEQQIIEKGQLLDLFMDINKSNDTLVSDQIGMVTHDLDVLIDELLKIRQDSEFIAPEVQGVIDRMGNIKTLSHEKLIENLKSKYLWQDSQIS